MRSLTTYIKSNPAQLFQLHHAIRIELEANRDEKMRLRDKLVQLRQNNHEAYDRLVREQGFNEDECRDVLRDIEGDIEKCFCCEVDENERIACVGDAVIGKLFNGRRVDVLVVVSSLTNSVFAWLVADCKFSMKRPSYGTVCDKNNFEYDVAAKYDAVYSDLKNECEPVWRKRLILVTTEAKGIVQRYVRQSSLSESHPLMGNGDYVLCDVDGISSKVQRARNQYRSAVAGGGLVEMFG